MNISFSAALLLCTLLAQSMNQNVYDNNPTLEDASHRTQRATPKQNQIYKDLNFFKRKNKFNIRICTNNSVRPYIFRCTRCSEFFYEQTDLEDHLKKHVAIKNIFFCRYCNFTCISFKSLSKHLKENHF